jgi:hypothetical protein
MSSLIRFKFKNSKDTEVVSFDGVELGLDALKQAILAKKGLTTAGVDLVISDAQTGQGTGVQSFIITRADLFRTTLPRLFCSIRS